MAEEVERGHESSVADAMLRRSDGKQVSGSPYRSGNCEESDVVMAKNPVSDVTDVRH